MGLAEKLKDFIGYPENDDFDNSAVRSRAAAPQPVATVPVVNAAVALVKLNRFEDASLVVDHLLSNRVVLFSMKDVTHELSRRLVDFLGGAAYAKNAQISRVSEATYLITPFNVGMVNDQPTQVDLGSIFF